MKKRNTIIFIFIYIITNGISYAKTVEYKYPDGGMKDIQLMGSIEADKEIKMNEYNYILTPVSGNGAYEDIPKYTSLEKSLIDKYGANKVNKLIESNILSIEGSYLRFITDIYKGWHNPIKVEEKKELKTNLMHRRKVCIDSDIDQIVTFKLFPISPNYYSGRYGHEFDENGLPLGKSLISLYDTSREYYKINIHMGNNTYGGDESYLRILEEKNPDKLFFKNYNVKFIKKYELFTFKKLLKNGEYWTPKAIIPYYEFTAQVNQGRNELVLSYMTHHFEGEPFQIR